MRGLLKSACEDVRFHLRPPEGASVVLVKGGVQSPILSKDGPSLVNSCAVVQSWSFILSVPEFQSPLSIARG